MAALATPPPAAPAAPAASAPTQAAPVTGQPPAGQTPPPATPSAPPTEPQTMDEALAQLRAVESSPEVMTPETTPPTSPEAVESPVAGQETQPQGEADLDEPISAADATSTEDGKKLIFDKNKGQRLLAAQQALNQMREIVPDLSVESFKQLAGRANAAALMMNLYHQAASPNVDPQARFQSMDEIVGYFGEQSPISLGFLAVRSQALLPKFNPTAAAEINNWHNSRVLNDLRGRVQQISDPALRDQEVNFIQNLEMRLTGKFTTKADLLAGTRTNPQQAVQSENDRLRQQIAEGERQRAQQAQAAMMGQIGQAQTSAINQVIEGTLASIKDRVSPREYSFLFSSLGQEVAQAELANPQWKEQYDTLLIQAQTTGSEVDIRRLAEYRRQIAQRVIRAQGPKIINEWTRSKLERSKAAAQTATNPPTNEPALNGVATPASPQGVDAMLKSDNWQDMFKAAGLR